MAREFNNQTLQETNQLPFTCRVQSIDNHSRTPKFAHQLFEECAARTPGKPAVACQGNELSYGELNARTNHLAASLRSMGVGPNTLVGISVERSLEMVIGILGVLKTGGVSNSRRCPAQIECRQRSALSCRIIGQQKKSGG